MRVATLPREARQRLVPTASPPRHPACLSCSLEPAEPMPDCNVRMADSSGRIRPMTSPDNSSVPQPAPPQRPVYADRVYRSPGALAGGGLLLVLAAWLGLD